MVDTAGAVRLPATVVPFSTFVSKEGKAAFLRENQLGGRYGSRSNPASTAELRQQFADRLQPVVDRDKVLYPVDIVATSIAGIYAQTITPKEGVAIRNRHRVLINLRGGGFVLGTRELGQLASIPVAGLGKIRVITIDYRQGPESKFPAASEDVAAVYRELLKTYEPRNIGIYGCSAGGVLTGEATAWIARQGLPTPGAIGIFCASAGGWIGGDSGHLAVPLSGGTLPAKAMGSPHPSVSNVAYFSDADFSDPMVQPIQSDAVLAKFPPTLIITATRDMAMSSAIHTHARLTKLGVAAELHVWDGLGHEFFNLEPDVPESVEVFQVIVKFFDQHLGAE
jgi:acetyl esterase/lipase